MGNIASMFVMLTATVGAGVATATMADDIRKKRFTEAKTKAAITGALAIIVVALCIYLLATGSIAPELIGVNTALVLMLIAMIGIAAMAFIALRELDEGEKRQPFEMAAGASTLAFGTATLALTLIVFLL